ncbi:hypothetical protein N7481_006169 [Penicillium waksmanii]|uniref:uncharacterized protein n=1 Tax=Penicillium waksmanii TaxID=69791 RepID=UPI00254916EE|nr:uncharacterized protein N7481_006169 [Penicillium waksmanii]KAJ5984070.1 hypothetical protein N7481_006169 [Penicillium waksmanii]
MRFLDSSIFKSSTNEATTLDVQFVQQNGDKYHEALGAKAHYNEVTTWFEPTPDSGYSNAEDDLRIALYEYNETTEEKYRLDLVSYTLNDVLLEIAEADGRYKEKEKGIAGAHRHVGRFAGDNADALRPWLELIPNDIGMSVLAGGLKAILNIAKKNAENRQKILRALHEIPDVMFQTQKQQNVFAAVPSIRVEAIHLYKILAHSLAHLITTLNPSRSKGKFREKAKRLGRKLIPHHSAAEIDELLSEAQTSVGKFRDCLQLVRDEYLVATHENSEVILDRVGEGFGHILQNISSLKRAFEASRMEQQIRHSQEVDSKNFLLVFFRSDPPNTPSLASSYSSQPQYPQPFLSDTDLFHAIGVHVNEPIEDVDHVLRHRDQFDIAAQTQAQQLLSSEDFMRWMKSSLAETLFVKGHFQMVGPGRISVLSALCATLSLQVNLLKNTHYIVLHAFCGLHEAHSHQNAGPNWLIRSLIAQLLLSGVTFNLDFINTRAFAERIKSHYLQDLCSIFRLLIEQLPNTATVVCIIDGVTRFESEIWKAEMNDVLFILNQTVRNEFLKPSFKLLLTTPSSNTRFLEDHSTICPHYIVNLRPTAVTSGRRISERGLLRGRSLEEYRTRMLQEEQDPAPDSEGEENDDDIFF